MNHSEQLNEYLRELEKEGKKPGTLKQYASDLKPFVSWLDSIEKDLRSVQSSDLELYVKRLEDSKLQYITVKRHLSAINQWLEFSRVDTFASSDHEKTHQAVPLRPGDFISEKEMSSLLKSMQKPGHSAARDVLIPRNLAIVHLMRYKGLRPKDISSITMNMLNLAQSTLVFKQERSHVTYKIPEVHASHILEYLNSIEQLKRPRWHSSDPLFVAFNNRSHDYQYDYGNEQPKRLSVRGIQEMIKDEVRLAGLRKLSAKHLRNSCILDHVMSGQQDHEIQRYFHLMHPFSLHRCKKYKEENGL
jgi:site-specific recombinase XerD